MEVFLAFEVKSVQSCCNASHAGPDKIESLKMVGGPARSVFEVRVKERSYILWLGFHKEMLPN